MSLQPQFIRDAGLYWPANPFPQAAEVRDLIASSVAVPCMAELKLRPCTGNGCGRSRNNRHAAFDPSYGSWSLDSVVGAAGTAASRNSERSTLLESPW